MKKLLLKIALLIVAGTTSVYAQINSTPAVVPFNSNPGYGTNGMMPTNLPTGGAFGKSQDAANAYNSWKSEFLENCSGGAIRVKFDVPSETVSEGIAYGMLLAAYAADKSVFDGLYQFWKNNSNQGLMHWKISGCNTRVGSGSATDADFDAAYALLVAANQWPSATAPHNYGSEFNTMIARIRQMDMAANGRATNGDSWHQNSCTNPSYQSPGYYQAFAEKNTANATFWGNTAYNFAYQLFNNNDNDQTGLVSNWSDANGTPNQCNPDGRGNLEPIGFGYDASRYPWRLAQDVLWYNGAEGRKLATRITNYMKGRGATNIGGPLNLNGTNGHNYQQNATFISMLTLAVMASDRNAENQTFLNSMYTRTVNSVSGDQYFGKTLRVISLFMLTGNFWKIGTTSDQDINIRATSIQVGTATATVINQAVADKSTYDFQNTQTTAGNPAGKTVTFTLENLGFQALNLTGNPRIAITGTDAALFTVSQPTTSTLAFNANTTFTVVFRPTTAGVKTAKIVIPSNDPDEPNYEINLTGLGTLNAANANMVISQYDNTPVACSGTLAFGNATNGAFATKVLKVKNTGDGALNLTTLTYSSLRFSTVGTAPATIAPGDSAVLVVQFNPIAAGPLSGTLTIANNDPTKSSCVINLTGTGVACSNTVNILHDFDNNSNLVQRTGNVNTTYTTAPNPYINDQNPSGNVGKLVIPALAGEYSKGIVLTPCTGTGQVIDFTGRTTLTMMIYSPAPGIPINFNLKDATGFLAPAYDPIAAGKFFTTRTNQWEKIVMDFGNQTGGVWRKIPDDKLTSIRFLEIFINNNDEVEKNPNELTFYFDNIQFEDNPCIAGIPTTKIFNDFDENQYLKPSGWSNESITANPFPSPLNPSGSVLRQARAAGTDSYDNIIRFAGCNGKVDMSINDGIFSLMVYTPVAGLPVQLNIMKEDGPDLDTHPDEVASVTAIAVLPNMWQKVYFDFSEYKNNKEIIAIDLFIDPTRARGAGRTYFVDKLQYDVLPDCKADITAANGILMDFEMNRHITKLYPNAPVFDDVTANPSADGNPSTLVGKLTRAATGIAASSIRYTACGSHFELLPGKNKIEMLVYAPQVGTEVAIDLKNAAGTSIKQVVQLTTVANAWEKMTFDFSDYTNNTNAVHMDIFFDLNAKFVTTAASRTYYLDDIRYATAVEPEIAVFRGAELRMNSAAESFGTVAIGDSSAMVTYTIRNFGNDLLRLKDAPEDLVISGTDAADFIIAKNPTYVTNISSGLGTNFMVYFKPTSGGTKSAKLTIANNDADENPFVINLSGVGICSDGEAPTVGTAAYTYCQGATATRLTATAVTGSTLAWYPTATGGTSTTVAPIPSTTAAGTTSYFVAQVTNGCESPRAEIVVTVVAAPTVNAGANVTTTDDFATLTATASAAGTWSQVSGPVNVTFIPGATSATVNVEGLTVVGLYTFRYTVAAAAPCTEVFSEVTVRVNEVTSTTASLSSNLRIFPNPASEVIKIEAKGMDAFVTVSDMYGRIIFAGNMSSVMELPIAGQPAGMYIVSVKNGDQIVTRPIVKN